MFTSSSRTEWAEPTRHTEPSGSNAPYYDFPEHVRCVQDLIEHLGLNFSEGNILKAAVRLGRKQGTSRQYDLEKIGYYQARELARVRASTSE